MKMYFCLTAAFLLLACGSRQESSVENSEITDKFLDCHSGSSRTGIVNGQTLSAADPDSKRAVLLIIRRGQRITSCTASVVANDTLLTAGHCLYKVGPGDVRAIFHPEMTCASGYNAGQAIRSAGIIVHPQYDGGSDAKNDLALLKLSSPVPAVYPIQSLYDGKEPLSGGSILMIGYGISSETTEDSLRLRKTYKSIKDILAIKGQNIVFDQKKSGVCNGDSGGPVLAQLDGTYKIIAVNSVVMGNNATTACHEMSAAMYIPEFLPWVSQALSQLH